MERPKRSDEKYCTEAGGFNEIQFYLDTLDYMVYLEVEVAILNTKLKKYEKTK